MALPIVVAGAWAVLRKLLWSVLLTIVPYVLSEAFLAVGVGFVAYVGISGVLDKISAVIYSNLSGLAADVYAILALAGLGQCLTIITSAFTAKMTLMGLSATGTLIRPVWGKGKK